MPAPRPLPAPMAMLPRPRERLQQQIRVPLPRHPELVLVTDLDGTLLDGPPRWRRLLYGWLARERERVLHVYSTGRDLRSVRGLLAAEQEMGLLPPHLVIGDVGCTLACGASLEPVPLAVEPIEAGPANPIGWARCWPVLQVCRPSRSRQTGGSLTTTTLMLSITI